MILTVYRKNLAILTVFNEKCDTYGNLFQRTFWFLIGEPHPPKFGVEVCLKYVGCQTFDKVIIFCCVFSIKPFVVFENMLLPPAFDIINSLAMKKKIAKNRSYGNGNC